ncbi:MAG: protein kinase [Verrucomicrobia bacterium]|nr:protein kinase [Verrucomicrobiota bacterium]
MLRRAFAPPSVPARPDDFGDYEVGEEIGRGGMGVVYRARQRALDREIALKLLPFELLESDDFLERFEREARLMARLTHPGIARVFEAGISRNGQAYLALELIAGQPLDDHLRVEDPPLPARLALFLQVAEAVQHAHERGIVHRDLKPSNVLVSTADGGSTAKVIDFGLARPSGDAGADAAIWRSQPAMVGTPLYISPEQAAGEEVDTRTDVYALGALLYEMLAGRPPFDEHDFRDASRAEVLRVLRGQEPPPPSARTAARRIDPDLDAICRRALARAPDERYATVAALAYDVRRFLALQPITARVPTQGYRAGLFVRRHRLALALASVFVLGLLSAAAFSLQQARQARLERDRAEKVKSFLFAVLNSPAPGVGGREVRVVEVLSAARERAEQELADDPATRWEVLLTLGTTYYELSQYAEAEPLLQAALRDAERAFGSESVPAGRVRKALGDLYNFSSRQPAAAESLLRAVGIFRRHLPSAHEHLMLALHALASVSIHSGEQRAAIPALEESLALAQRSDTLAARLHRVVVLGDLAPCYEAVGRQAEGRALTEQAVRAARQYPQLRENLATLLSNSAEDLAEAGDCAGAAAAAEESYRLRSALHGARSQSAGIGQARLAQTQRHCGDFVTAERNAREALAILRSVSAPQARELFHPLRALGLTLLEAGRPAEAEPVLTELVAVLALRQPQSPLLTTAREALARARATAAP